MKIYAHAVIDSHTSAVMGKYTSLKAAHRRADKLDVQYGAVRYIVQPISLSVAKPVACFGYKGA